MEKLKKIKKNILLIPILILSAILNLWNLGIEGYANQYYAAGVKSMTLSFKNFFFVSFDPAGFVTIDKPAFGFWIQAISAKIFGFSGWSIILPQAIAGVISVAVIYHIVKRSFGKAAGLISALCLATTPIFVAVSRNNTIDNLLVLTLLLACWALSIAAEKGKLKYLIISMVLVGIGFNIKMLEAYMVAPALYITYLLSNAVSLKKRIIHLIAGTVVLLLVSFSWAIIVDLVPKSDRPFVGSSTNNSVMELIFGHNGIERLSNNNSGPGGMKNPGKGGQFEGMPGGGPSGNNGQNQGMPGGGSSGNNGQNQGMPSGAPNAASGQMQGMGSGGTNGFGGPDGSAKNSKKFKAGGRGGSFGGTEKASITRLFSNNDLSDQIIWLFPLAIFGFAAAVIKEKFKYPFDNKRSHALILWSMWLLPVFIYFSYTKGLFHPYYLTMMAPPIAALTGIGIVSMWKLFKEGGWKSYILPTALIVTGLVQILILSYYYDISKSTKIITALISVFTFVPSAVLIVINILKNKNIKLNKVVTSISLIGVLIAPTYWSSTTLSYASSGTFPSAGVELKSSNNKMGSIPMGNSKNSSNKKLVEFLKKNKTKEKYLVAVSSASGTASDIIINYGESVMALGGFSGSDKILSLSEFKNMVKKGEIRYVLVGGMGNGSNDIMNWVKENGKVVSESEWKDSNAMSKQIENKNNYSNNSNTAITAEYNNNINKNASDDSKNNMQQFAGVGGGNAEQLYDLGAYAKSLTK